MLLLGDSIVIQHTHQSIRYMNTVSGQISVLVSLAKTYDTEMDGGNDDTTYTVVRCSMVSAAHYPHQIFSPSFARKTFGFEPLRTFVKTP